MTRMDVREKLVEILRKPIFPHELVDPTEAVADYLLDSGVTVQEWISVEDKLPPYNRDVLVYRPNMAMKILVDNYAWHYRDDGDEWYEDWALYGKDTNGNPVVTHWAYLPNPPKCKNNEMEAKEE